MTHCQCSEYYQRHLLMYCDTLGTNYMSYKKKQKKLDDLVNSNVQTMPGS